MTDSTPSAKNSSESDPSTAPNTHCVDPEYFADVHQTPAGALLFQDERDSDAWISSDVVKEVRR
jgi:hypothetical protein